MGLVTPVELPELAELGPVHFIAIGGSGMNGIARVMLSARHFVSGSDRQDSKYLRALEQAGARVHVGHRAEQLGEARTVVASSAIREDNPELAEARRRGLRVLHRSVALGTLMAGRRGIAVAGTHGKTTTTAMIAQVLTGCGFDPSYVIGGALTGSASGGHLGTGDLMVVEADESDGSFLQYPAEVAVVTNVDPDHLSNWGTAERYADGFLRFATGSRVRLLVVSADDPGAVALTARVRERITAGIGQLEIVTFGHAPAADVRISAASLAGMGSQVRAGAGRRGRAGDAGGARVVQRAERRGRVRGGALVRRRRGPGAARAVGVSGDVPAVPADRRGRRRPGLRRLRAPSDRGLSTPWSRPARWSVPAGWWCASSRTCTPALETSGGSWPPRWSRRTRRS